jgi:hypothetical protein
MSTENERKINKKSSGRATKSVFVGGPSRPVGQAMPSQQSADNRNRPLIMGQNEAHI